MERSIRFLTARCRVGHVLLAAGDRGICQLRLGAAASSLERDFLIAFPGALRAASGDPLHSWCDAVVAQLDAWGGQGAPPQLPLALGGTTFQRRVWKQLTRIPAGEVRTYGEVAAAIGSPNAVRAVATACASNPVAVLVPCHRVVPTTGGTGRYRWGAEIKRALLGRETALAASRPASATRR